MEPPIFLAKSKPQETIRKHADAVLRKLNDIFELYGDEFTDNEKRLARLACEYHDYGKIDRIFQETVRGKRKTVETPHGFLSGEILSILAKENGALDGLSDEEIRALYTAIHYHHVHEDVKKRSEYREYALENLKDNFELLFKRQYEPSFAFRKRLLFTNDSTSSDSDKLGSFYRQNPSSFDRAFAIYWLVKGLLNKADYAASGRFDVELAPREPLTRKIYARFGAQLRPAQRFMRDNREKNVVAIAPTGSGKTEGALLWIDDRKGFYTLPLKVSANAIYRRIYESPFETKSGGAYGWRDVGLLHSDSFAAYLNDDESASETETSRPSYAKYRAARNLAYPLTITTVDQLFKFVFKALGTEIFAATLKYSRVVVDEMQMYEPELLAMLIYGLKIVSEAGGKFAIVTATLPKFILNKLKSENIPFESGKFVGDERRHIVRLISPTSISDDRSFDDETVDAIRESGLKRRVLVVCNTVGTAQALKKQIPEANLLHSRFIRRDRKELERRIIEFQANPENKGIWIATQLVEASLDVDFDELHTEACSADSLLQRMGRCWRSRTYDRSEPNVFVYDRGPSNVYDSTIYKRSLDALRQYEGRIFTEREKLEYVDAVFDEAEIKDSEYIKDLSVNKSRIYFHYFVDRDHSRRQCQ